MKQGQALIFKTGTVVIDSKNHGETKIVVLFALPTRVPWSFQAHNLQPKNQELIGEIAFIRFVIDVVPAIDLALFGKHLLILKTPIRVVCEFVYSTMHLLVNLGH